MFKALFQIYVFRISGSVALLADIIRNFGDAVTAIPPGFAFLLSLKNLTTDSLTVTAEQKTLQVC
jgi:divalent metal cation (Fe/Co/Zn/Cd) transporter